MRAYKKIGGLCLAMILALGWNGLSLAAETKVKKKDTFNKASTDKVSKEATAGKPEPKAKQTKKKVSKKKTAKKKTCKKKPPAKPLNINTASAKEFQHLAGVGPKTAKAIIDYRKKHGKFKKPEDIMKVKGIGKKTFGKNKAFIKIK